MATVGGMSSLKDSQSSLQTAVRKFTSQITTPVYRVSFIFPTCINYGCTQNAQTDRCRY